MKMVVIIFFCWALIQLAYIFLWPTDTTDKSRWNRSGMSVYTDNATGIQYVKAGFFGGITPRINSDGRPYSVK